MFYNSVQRIFESTKIWEEAEDWKILHKGADNTMAGAKHEAVNKVYFETMTITDGWDLEA
jgi:hypothetical protein